MTGTSSLPKAALFERVCSLNPPRWIWRAGIALMTALALGWLSYQTYRYFADPEQLGERQVAKGAIDVHNRYDEVRSWFRGEPVYRIHQDAVYPPASYAILGLVFNGLPWGLAKILWFVASVASVATFSLQLVRHSLASSWQERVFLGLMPFAFYATGAALGNGQLVVFVLPLVLSALLILGQSTLSKRRVWMGSLLMLLALVQPTLAAPFFWLVLFRSPRWRPAVVVVSVYLALTAFAVAFQMRAFPRFGGTAKPMGVLTRWTARAPGGAYMGSIKGGYGTVHNLLAELGLQKWNTAASLAILALLGLWIFRHRRADFWLLMGVTAILARIWTYHRWYDDLLLLFPLVVLFRLTRIPEVAPRVKLVAGVLFLWLWGFLLAPGVLYTVRSPGIWVGLQVSGWLVALAFLVWVVETRRHTQDVSGSDVRLIRE
ncbi:MAG: hypothetical protein RLZ45_1504 [Verrucomicrobiota bacterium]